MQDLADLALSKTGHSSQHFRGLEGVINHNFCFFFNIVKSSFLSRVCFGPLSQLMVSFQELELTLYTLFPFPFNTELQFEVFPKA